MGTFETAAELAKELYEQHGIPREEAVKLVSRGLVRAQVNSGMGQPEIMAHIEKAREQISPWLWVLSIAGFGMALLNTRRVSKMFKKWKKGRA